MATPQVASFVQLATLISSLRTVTNRFPPEVAPKLADALEQIQAFIDQTSARLAAQEVPIVQNQMDLAAGLPLGYGIITLGNRQVKFEIFDLK